MKYILITFAALILFGFFSCDVIESGYREDPKTIAPAGDTVRKILLEEYTGFKCGFCPPANQKALDIYDLYKGRVVIMTVHAGSLAEPDSKHTYDFTTEAGDELYEEFGEPANPAGLVNRTEYDGSLILKQDKWETAVSQFVEDKPQMMIEIENSYKGIARLIETDVKIKYLVRGSANHRLSVVIVEDSIVQFQKWYGHQPTDIEDYVHNHILRAAVNGTWGEPLGEAAAGGFVEKTFSFVVPEDEDGNPLWRPEKIKIIAFVHNLGSGSYEVLQVEEKGLIE